MAKTLFALTKLIKLQEEYAAQGLKAMREDLLDRTLNLNVEYRVPGAAPAVSFSDPSTNDDIGKNLITDGLLMVEKKGGRRFAQMVDAYVEAMNKAKKDHLNIWEYGDITSDEAKEFGYGR
jgi:staphylococcal nuclease domain-containing protein 1